MSAAAATPSPERRAGLVLRLDGQARFVSGDVVQRLAPSPALFEVSSGRLWMALVEGQVLPVLELSPRGSALVVCEVEGEPVALSGTTPLECGFFDAVPGGVRFGRETARELHVAELVSAVTAALDQAVEQAHE